MSDTGDKNIQSKWKQKLKQQIKPLRFWRSDQENTGESGAPHSDHASEATFNVGNTGPIDQTGQPGQSAHDQDDYDGYQHAEGWAPEQVVADPYFHAAPASASGHQYDNAPHQADAYHQAPHQEGGHFEGQHPEGQHSESQYPDGQHPESHHHQDQYYDAQHQAYHEGQAYHESQAYHEEEHYEEPYLDEQGHEHAAQGAHMPSYQEVEQHGHPSHNVYDAHNHPENQGAYEESYQQPGYEQAAHTPHDAQYSASQHPNAQYQDPQYHDIDGHQSSDYPAHPQPAHSHPSDPHLSHQGHYQQAEHYQQEEHNQQEEYGHPSPHQLDEAQAHVSQGEQVYYEQPHAEQPPAEQTPAEQTYADQYYVEPGTPDQPYQEHGEAESEEIAVQHSSARELEAPSQLAPDIAPETTPATTKSRSKMHERLNRTRHALITVPTAHTRNLAKRIPEPVQLHLRRGARHSAFLGLEIFAGLIVVGLVALTLFYGKINQGTISVSFLVSPLEAAINREIDGLRIKIDDAVVRRKPQGSGMTLRIKNIRLLDDGGAIVARAPEAAVSLSGQALLSGRIAPGRVEFIGARVLAFYSKEEGLTLRFSDLQDKDENSAANNERLNTDPSNTALSGQQNLTRQKGGAQATLEIERPDGRAGLSASARPGADEKQIHVVRSISDAFESARRSKTASAYLKNFGMRDTVVIFDNEGHQTVWRMPDFDMDFEHRQKRSILRGKGAMASGAAHSWNFGFQVEQSEKLNQLTVKVTADDVLPREMAANFPNFYALNAFGMPVSVATNIALSDKGDLLDVDVKLKMAAGWVDVPWEDDTRLRVDEGLFHVQYQKQSGQIILHPSNLRWGESFIRFSGLFDPAQENTAQGASNTKWTYKIQADKALFGVEKFGLAPTPLDHWVISGAMDSKAGIININDFDVGMLGARFKMKGQISSAPGSPEIELVGGITPMHINTFKLIWPAFMAPKGRKWVGEKIEDGQLTSGSVRVSLKAGDLLQVKDKGHLPEGAIKLDLAGHSLKINYLNGPPAMRTGAGKLTMRGHVLQLDMPESQVDLPSGESIKIRDGVFTIADMREKPSNGNITFKLGSTAEAARQYLQYKPFSSRETAASASSAQGENAAPVQGAFSGEFSLDLPLKDGLKLSDLRLKGQARLRKLKRKALFGKVDLTGGRVDFGITEKAVQSKGELLLNNVPAQIEWHRIFGAPENKQSPLRISAVLDDSARAQLNLPVNTMIRGPMPMTVSLRPAGARVSVGGQNARAQNNALKGEYNIHVDADLSGATLDLGNLGLTKPPGQAAFLQFDFLRFADGRTSLDNLQVNGDAISIKGRVDFDARGLPAQFHFPKIYLNKVSQLAVQGAVQKNKIWKIKMAGPSYDGRNFFRSLFSPEKLGTQSAAVSQFSAGVDFTAQIGTMIGFSKASAKDLTVSVKRRKGLLTALEAQGKVNEAPIAVRLEKTKGRGRQILAESADAGAVFRMIGFYPNMEGGQASLKVNLDAKGNAAKTGTLWARNFFLLGDAIVKEVLENSANKEAFRRARQRANQTAQDRILFEQLRVPFSVGHGQFVLHDSYINGPLLGATLRGRVDYNNQRLNIGGTYIPLFGLNSAIGALPLIGNILVGRRGEGLIGMTFAVQGAITRPQVLVNPVSIAAPGVFRQIFEFTDPAPSVIPRNGNARTRQQRRVKKRENETFN